MKEKFIDLLNRTIYEKNIDIIWLLIIPIINVNYFFASIISKNGITLNTVLDNKIPFNSFFIIPYVYWYAYVVIGFILIMKSDRKKYMRAVIATFIGMMISYMFFYIFPTQIARPVVDNSNILNKLVNLIYSNDRPVNCFPSLHVLNAYFIMRYTKIDYSKNKFYYTQIVGILIILSTVFIKQHFVYDIFGAIIICEIVISLVNKIDDEKIEGLLELPYMAIEKIKLMNDKSRKQPEKTINSQKKEGLI